MWINSSGSWHLRQEELGIKGGPSGFFSWKVSFSKLTWVCISDRNWVCLTMWSHGESGSGRQGLQQLLKVLIHVIWFCVLLLQPVRMPLPSLDPYTDSRPDLDCRCHPASSFLVLTESPWGGWEERWPALLLHAQVFAIAENLASVCVFIGRQM